MVSAPAPFRFEVVPAEIAVDLQRAYQSGDITLVKAQTKRARVLLLQQEAARRIADNADRLADDDEDFDEDDFVSESHSLLKDAMLAAFLLSAGMVWRSKGEDWASAAAMQQTTYLQGFATDVRAAAGTDKALSAQSILARAELYAGQIWGAFQRGKVAYTDDNFRAIWHTHPEETISGDSCALCADRDGEEYDETTLPGFPGEGDFGELCEGAGHCHCELEILGGSH